MVLRFTICYMSSFEFGVEPINLTSGYCLTIVQLNKEKRSMTSKPTRPKKEESTNPDLNLNSIGNYVFSKTLGEGNFAKVKLAKHKLTNAEVFIIHLNL